MWKLGDWCSNSAEFAVHKSCALTRILTICATKRGDTTVTHAHGVHYYVLHLSETGITVQTQRLLSRSAESFKAVSRPHDKSHRKHKTATSRKSRREHKRLSSSSNTVRSMRTFTKNSTPNLLQKLHTLQRLSDHCPVKFRKVESNLVAQRVHAKESQTPAQRRMKRTKIHVEVFVLVENNPL